MPNYRRAKLPGGTYFLTQVTHERQPWLIGKIGREALRTAIVHVRKNILSLLTHLFCYQSISIVYGHYLKEIVTYRLDCD